MSEEPEEDERLYDPMPDAACAPWPPRNYEGTGIGGLYGGRFTNEQAVSLAGWTIARPADRRHQLEGWDYEPGSRPK